MRMKRVNVVVGANGCGKSNLYKALHLVASAASGTFSRSLAQEGGLGSALWAGDRGKGPVRMRITVKLDGGLKYELACGLPVPGQSPFPLDPIIKEEEVSFVDRGQKVILLNRKGGIVHARDGSGKRVEYPSVVPEGESVLSELREPHLFPELSKLRHEFLSWRFYHKFRTDEESVLRRDAYATRVMSLSHDASDLAAALATIQWVGDREGLEKSVDDAFPGAKLEIGESGSGKLQLQLLMPGFQRPFKADELSDGTLHYLCLLAALMSPRPAKLLALNEPEASIHPDLLDPLATLIRMAARESQIWVITHSFRLAKAIEEHCLVEPIVLQKIDGETKIAAQKLAED
jgi:predicted ATPase